MTIGEVKEVVAQFMRGDNSQANPTPFIIQQSILEVATRCEPRKLYTDDLQSTKIYRKLYDENGKIIGAIRYPTIGDESDELDIDDDLHLAVVFFVCAYFSNKSKEYYEQKAERIISLYKSNSNL